MNAEAWMVWENQVVNGTFPLRRLLGSSTCSAVFLTEHKAKGLADAAIKLVRADTVQVKEQLARWQAAAVLPHPNLVRLFGAGRCLLEGRQFLFVVMEHADQTLAQILLRRALVADEARELMLPTLDALAFLHRNQRVHGQLKPSNFVAVNDQLKLASDTIRPPGNVAPAIVGVSPYDPPELGQSGGSSASDMWSLGVILIEALTQRTPSWFDLQSRTALLAGSLPAPFSQTARRCLSVNPAERPTAVELRAQYGPAPEAKSDPQPPSREAQREATSSQVHETSPKSAPPQPREASLEATSPPAGTTAPKSISPQARESSRETTPPQAHENAPKSISSQVRETSREAPPPPSVPSRRLPLKAIAAAFAVALAASVGLHFMGTAQDELQLAPVPTPAPVTSPPVFEKPATPEASPSITASAPPTQPSLSPVTTSSEVLHEVTPDVPPKIQDKIRGRIYVTVRVLVDSSGNVVGALMENPGPSQYFARLADNASREWQFIPTDNQSDRVWLLRYEFRRDGVSVRATPQ